MFYFFFFGFLNGAFFLFFNARSHFFSFLFLVPSDRYSKLKHNLQYFAAHSLIIFFLNIKIRDNMRKSYEHHDLC